MKKLTYLICLFLGLSATMQAQSKLSYTLLINQSASTDPMVDVCILQTNGGRCLGSEQAWKTNITLNVNHQMGKRLRLQSGLGYNVFSQNDLNDDLETNRYNIKYLSIPVRLHYLITNGKVKFYTGLGFRTDIRLNSRINITELANLADTGRGMAISLEGLIGVEIPLSDKLKLQFEPTFSEAVTSYASAPAVRSAGANILVGTPFTLIDEYPSRIGVSLGFTYRF